MSLIHRHAVLALLLVTALGVVGCESEETRVERELEQAFADYDRQQAQAREREQQSERRLRDQFEGAPETKYELTPINDYAISGAVTVIAGSLRHTRVILTFDNARGTMWSASIRSSPGKCEFDPWRGDNIESFGGFNEPDDRGVVRIAKDISVSAESLQKQNAYLYVRDAQGIGAQGNAAWTCIS